MRAATKEKKNCTKSESFKGLRRRAGNKRGDITTKEKSFRGKRRKTPGHLGKGELVEKRRGGGIEKKGRRVSSIKEKGKKSSRG